MTTPYAGEQNGRSKLNRKRVYAMRLLHALELATIDEMAEWMNVSYNTAYKATTGKSWRDINVPSPTNGVVCVPVDPLSDGRD